MGVGVGWLGKLYDRIGGLGDTTISPTPVPPWSKDTGLPRSRAFLVTVPQRDLGVGELIVTELEQHLGSIIELVPLEELARVLEQTQAATVVTSCYFFKAKTRSAITQLT